MWDLILSVLQLTICLENTYSVIIYNNSDSSGGARPATYAVNGISKPANILGFTSSMVRQARIASFIDAEAASDNHGNYITFDHLSSSTIQIYHLNSRDDCWDSG